MADGGRYGPFGIRVPLHVSILGRVGVDQDPRRPALLGIEHLQAPEQPAVVADEYDPPLDLDTHLFQGLEVLRRAVVRIDNLAGDIPRDAVAVERGKGVGVGGVLVAEVRVLHDLQFFPGWPGDLQRDQGGDRVVEQDLILGQIGRPAPRAELVADEQRGLPVGLGAGDVRALGQRAEPGSGVSGGRNGQSGLFRLELIGPRAGGETDRSLAPRGSRSTQNEYQQNTEHRKSSHQSQPLVSRRLTDPPRGDKLKDERRRESRRALAGYDAIA